MPDKSADAKKAWQTMKLEEAHTKLIVILKKSPDWAAQSCYMSNDPDKAETFMWGRREENYQLFIRGREYKWASERDPTSLIKHIAYCIKFDQDFFKDPELDFPKGETFVTKKDLSSTEE